MTGAEVDYNGQPAGYAADPSETVTYVDAHDNETLFDVLQYKLPQATAMADRVRMNTVALATTALSQGPSFWHAGTDLLRSKSLDRNSYDSGDWFNRIDWTGERLDVGLGPAAARRQRVEVAVHAAAARRPGAGAGGRPTWPPPPPRPPSCCASASRRRCSGSARRSGSRSASASRSAGPARRRA